MFNVNIS